MSKKRSRQQFMESYMKEGSTSGIFKDDEHFDMKKQISDKKKQIHKERKDTKDDLELDFFDPILDEVIQSQKQIKNVESDGNCFYRAISYSLTYTEDNWVNIKKFLLMCCYLQFGQIILREEETSFTRSQFYEKYIQDARWADIETKGLTLSRILQRKVCLWKNNIKPFQKPYRVYGEAEKYFKYPININYTGNHFQSIIVLDEDEEPCQKINPCYDNNSLLDIFVENYFNTQILYSDNEHSDITDEDFFQDVSEVQSNWENVLQIFSTKFGYEFLSDNRVKPKKRQSRKLENCNNIPKDIFTQKYVEIEGFKCCQYKYVYQVYQNRDNCDTYNEKFQHLKSQKANKQLSKLWYPTRITEIKDYKKRNRKMYKFRETLTNYRLLKCQICQKSEGRLVYVENQKMKFILFQDQINDFLDLFHADMHRKRDEMMQVFNKLGIMFMNMRKLIEQKIESCDICQQENVIRKRPACKQIISTFPFERVQIDCCELHSSLHQKGLHQIIVIRDHFSRFTKVYPVKNKEAKTIRNSLLNFYNFVIPQILQSDNGKEFKNQIIEDLCKQYDIDFIHGRPYHPQSQGSVERFNRWVHTKLVQLKLTQGEDFDLEQSIIQLCINYNNKITRVTGQKPNDVIKLDRDDDKQKLEEIVSKVQNSFPKSKNPLDFQINSKALLSNRVESQKGKNSLVQKYSLKKKHGDLHLYNIPVTISKINQSNVSIVINKNISSFNKDEEYLCPTIFLKQVQDRCWEKFLDQIEENTEELDMDQLKEIEEEEEYLLTPNESCEDDEQLEENQNKQNDLEKMDELSQKIKNL